MYIHMHVYIIYTCAMTHVNFCHDSWMSVTWLIAELKIIADAHIHKYVNTYTSLKRASWFIYMCHDSFTRFTELKRIVDAHVCDDPFICVPWLIDMCAMTHSHLCHDSFTRFTELKRIVDAHVCDDPFICVPWLIDMRAMTHSHLCHDSFIFLPWLIHMSGRAEAHCRRARVRWPIHMCAMTH